MFSKQCLSYVYDRQRAEHGEMNRYLVQLFPKEENIVMCLSMGCQLFFFFFFFLNKSGNLKAASSDSDQGHCYTFPVSSYGPCFSIKNRTEGIGFREGSKFGGF